MVTPARCRVLLLEQLFVPLGLHLGVIDRDVTALPRVAVKHVEIAGAVQDRDELAAEVDGVMDAAVHAHRADRAVDVGGIAGEDRAPGAERGRHALMHRVENAVDDLVRLGAGQEPLQLILDMGVAQHDRRIVVDIGREMHAPALRLHPLEQVRPLARVRQVVAVGVTVVLGEVVAHGHSQGALGIGIAFELDVQRLAHDAARAFRAHDKAAGDPPLAACFVGDHRGYAPGILREALERRSDADFAVRKPPQQLPRLVDDLGAFALQNVRKAGISFEHAVVEFRKHLIVLAVPVLEFCRDQPARFYLRIEPEIVEHFERGGMNAAGARLLVDKFFFAQGLDQTRPDAALRQVQRKTQPNRSSTDDQDRQLSLCHRGFRKKLIRNWRQRIPPAFCVAA